jgi:hypothetical protein
LKGLSRKSQEERSTFRHGVSRLVWFPDEAAEEEMGERRVSGNSEVRIELAWEADSKVMMEVRLE